MIRRAFVALRSFVRSSPIGELINPPVCDCAACHERTPSHAGQ